MVLAAAGIPTIVCGKNSLHMVMLSPDDCYKQKNRQIAYSLITECFGAQEVDIFFYE